MKLTERSAKWARAVEANIEEASGKSIAAWAKLAKKAGMDKDPSLTRRWLKAEHGLTIVQTSFVVNALFPPSASNEDALLDAQFSGPKAPLRPIYDKLAKLAQALGDDVMIAPRKTQVTFARDVTFAVVRAATRTRVDLALRLPGEKATVRLVANPKAMGTDPTHIVALASAGEVDAEVKTLLRQAYGQAVRRRS